MQLCTYMYVAIYAYVLTINLYSCTYVHNAYIPYTQYIWR